MTAQNPGNAKIDVVDTKPCSVTFSIEVPHGDVASETEKVFKEIQGVARIPGFRPGKAPMELVKANYIEKAREQVIENLIQHTAFGALKSKGIEPVDSPRIETVDFDFNKPFTYKLTAERHPEFKVKDYAGIKITKEIREVTDAKVKENLESLRERNARLEASKSETVVDTSFVVVDYQAFQGTEAVEELSTKGYLLDLSAPQSIIGFKEGLLGARRGEEREFSVTFPADYPTAKLAGRAVTFKAKVQDIKEKVLPPVDDEFAKDFGVANVGELETKIREAMTAEEKKRQDHEVEKQVIDHLLAHNAFCVPDSLVDEQLKNMLGRMVEYARRQGLPDAVWQKNLDEWRKKYRPEAENNVRLSYILNAIIKEEKIDVTDADTAAELEKLKTANPGKEAEVEKYFNEHKAGIASRMKEEKLFAFLISQAKVKEEKAKEEKPKA